MDKVWRWMCCGQRFNTFNGMRRHIAEMHRGDRYSYRERGPVRIMQCAFCGECVVGMGGLKTHTVRRHGNWRTDDEVRRRMEMSSVVKDVGDGG